ncbi:hypothetical protein L1887_04331 [Cichorium endivia]|nr:hypothetical protein L1887_04331 [Cichorium endivia]
MELENDAKSVSEAGKSFSVPVFLRKVFTKELGDDGGLNHKLLAIAVRAVLLESGFLEIDPVSNSLKGNNNDNSFDVLASFYYTLPAIITTGNIETVKIKFQKLGNYCKVYGSLVNGIVHSVLLDEDKLVPSLNVLWANCGQVIKPMGDTCLISSVQSEQEVFEFWRKTKDGLALPLLIDLCEKTGLELPPCFMLLPTELKLKILDSVSGVDIANVSCVCSEFRYLASSDDLWKQKYVTEFRNHEGSGSERCFKKRFVEAWEGRKRNENEGSCLNRMRRNRFNPFGGDLGGDDYNEWLNIARLYLSGIGARRATQE